METLSIWSNRRPNPSFRNEHVCVETTAASPEILNHLLSWARPSQTLVVRVAVPLDLCLERVATREQTNQIPMDLDSIRRICALSIAAEAKEAFTIENAALSDSEIVSRFASALTHQSRGVRPPDASHLKR